jgi:protein-disulfide isomerase
VSKNAWIIFVAVCVVLFGGLVFLSQKNRVDVSNVNANAIQSATKSSGNIADHVFGDAKSPVMLVEYGDFQCPGCEGAYPGLKALSEKYKGQISFVFRNFPLTTIHPNALAAAAAAEAAGSLGKYWEMHNALYDQQSDWVNLSAGQRTAFFSNLAGSLGVDKTAFEKKLTSDDINKKIKFDQAIGKKINVTATPTLYLNGQKLDDDTVGSLIQGDSSKLEAKIVAALKQHDIELPKTDSNK